MNLYHHHLKEKAKYYTGDVETLFVSLSVRVVYVPVAPRHFDVNIQVAPTAASQALTYSLISYKVTLVIHVVVIRQLHCNVVANSQRCFDLILRYEAAFHFAYWVTL